MLKRIIRKILMIVIKEIDNIRFMRIDIENEKKKPRYKCSMCGNRFYSYYPSDYFYLAMRWMDSGILIKRKDIVKQYRCPYCDSLSRKRMVFSYLKKDLERFRTVLYMSPTQSGMNYLKRNYPKLDIVTNDKYLDSCDYQYDIENMYGFKDNSFDFIICSHILEHVHDDKKAIKEMYRVIRPKGIIAVMVPILLEGSSYKENTNLSAKENWINFGDSTHVRAYSKKGMLNRIQELGFNVELIDKNSFSVKEQRRNAMLDDDCIYLIKK